MPKRTLRRSRRLTKTEVRDILALQAANVSSAAIAAAKNLKPGRVRMVKHRNNLPVQLSPKTILKKRVTDGRVGLLIKKYIREDPKRSAEQIRALLGKELSEKIKIPHKATICRFLDNNGYVLRVMKSATMIRPANVQKRLEWAQQYVDIDPAFWDRVVWSDETSIQAIPQHAEISIRVHASTKAEKMPKKAKVQGGSFSVMFWGMFSIYGKGPLVALAGSVNSETYVDVLEEELLPELEELKRRYGVKMVFMQDNARPHTANATEAFLAKHKVELLPWPPQSPDVNPIENVWAWIKRERMRRYPTFPKNRDELIDQVFEIWESLPDKWFKPYAMSVVRRVEAVLKASGGNTKY